MSHVMILPELGENVLSGKVVAVLVKVGDVVELEQPVIEIETDKAVAEVPADAAGRVTAIYVEEDQELKVGEKILELDAAGEETDSPAGETDSSAEETDSSAEEADFSEKETGLSRKVSESNGESAASTGEGVPATPDKVAPAAPSVRRFAREIGIPINAVPGSGPGGRISREDVKAYSKQLNARRPDAPPIAPATQAEPLPDFSRWGAIQRKPMSTVRRRTAEHLSRAWTVIPHVNHFDKADMTHLEEFRKTHSKKVDAAGGKLTVTAILLKTVTAALKIFPRFNASVDMQTSEIVYKQYYNVGVAVDTDRGLLVPVIHDADKKSLLELAVELSELAELARTKKLPLKKMQGGNFTISNLGGIGGTAFTPIIHYPEVAILGVARGQTEMRYRNGEFEPRLMLPLSLSYDHRLIDGADAARFTRWIVEALEQPLLLSL
jgi:pyruvate dehydrogenase E2 component (dihydrolipoamide acetyltransferase)